MCRSTPPPTAGDYSTSHITRTWPAPCSLTETKGLLWRKGEIEVADDITLFDNSFYYETGYELVVRDELAMSMRNIFAAAQAATGTDLEGIYADANLVTCYGEQGACHIEKLDDVALGEPGADAVLTMGSSWDGSLYHIHKMMVAADYGDYDYASYGRFSCSSSNNNTRCSIAAPEESSVTVIAEGIELHESFNQPSTLVLRGEAAQSLEDLFDLAQSFAETDIDLREAYFTSLFCEDGECRLRGPYFVDFDQQQGPVAGTIRSEVGSEGDGLYYVLKMMVLAELGDFDGASHGAFTCRYINDQTVCDIAP